MSIEHREFRASVRKLAQTKIAPHAADVDDKERFPSESWAACAATTFPDLHIPRASVGVEPISSPRSSQWRKSQHPAQARRW